MYYGMYSYHMECGASASGRSLIETLTVVFCLSHVEAVTQRRDCKQSQNHTHFSTCRRMELTPFNAHRRSLSSVAVTAVHGLHYTATNLRNRARSKC